jgi:hypothetical protein
MLNFDIPNVPIIGYYSWLTRREGNGCEMVSFGLVLQRGLVQRGWKNRREPLLWKRPELVRLHKEHVRDREKKRHNFLLQSVYRMALKTICL